jgi:hypothetical protein
LSDRFTNQEYRDLYAASPQAVNSKAGGYVNISFVPEISEVGTDDEEEITKDDLYLQATLATIEKARAQGFQYKDIVLLTRKGSRVYYLPITLPRITYPYYPAKRC